MLGFIFGFVCGILACFVAVGVAFLRFGAYERPQLKRPVSRPLPRASDRASRAAGTTAVPDYLVAYDEGVDTETCAWFDIFLHKYFESFCSTMAHIETEAVLNKRLSALEIPEFVGPVVVQQIHFGDIIPIIRSVKVLNWRNDQPLIMEFDLSYNGDAYISLETELRMNKPFPGFASLPIELAVSDIEIDAIIQVAIDTSLEAPAVSVTFPEAPFIDFQLQSQVGYKFILKDLPHLKNVFHVFLMSTLKNELIAPNQKELKPPGLNLLHRFRSFRRYRTGSGRSEDEDGAVSEHKDRSPNSGIPSATSIAAAAGVTAATLHLPSTTAASSASSAAAAGSTTLGTNSTRPRRAHAARRHASTSRSSSTHTQPA